VTSHEFDAAVDGGLFELAEDDRDRIMAEMGEAFDGPEPWWFAQEEEARALAYLRDEVNGDEGFPDDLPEPFTPRPCTPEDDLDIRIA
jgi:hypothetical protein